MGNSMMKNITFVFALLSIMTLSACSASGSWYIRGKSEKTMGEPTKNTIEAGIEGRMGRFLKPALDMLADLGVYTYSDWEGLNPSEFKISIDETNSVSSIIQNNVLISVYSDDLILGQKNFGITKSGSHYVLSNPEAVKNWSLQFVDIGDRVVVDFEVDTKTRSTSLVTVNVHDKHGVKTSVRYEEVFCGGGKSEVSICHI